MHVLVLVIHKIKRTNPGGGSEVDGKGVKANPDQRNEIG
jgi:hypothetical protein